MKPPTLSAEEWHTMKRHYNIFFSLLVFISLGSWCFAQGSVTRSHTVRVIVNTLTYLSVSSGAVTITIDATNATAGVDAMTNTNSSTTLYWATNSSLRKVTVKTDLVAPYQLSVYAIDVATPDQINGPAVAAPQVTLSTTAADFLTNIGRSMGSCTPQYTLVALASAGIGTYTEHLTFTIQAQ
jgi:hypothetical protein